MTLLDYIVLIVYFVVMIGIGVWSMLLVKRQEDFFLGRRTFGRLFQAFAAFGAGTGSQDPVFVGRTTFTSGLSGIWSVLLWLFVTPFYWFTAVWYRRMRHITLGDWFAERYQSKGLGCVFMLYSVAFYAAWLGVGFTAIGKVGAPLLEGSTFVKDGQMVLFGFGLPIEHALVYICAAVVLIYGVLGGLRAAYWTDVIQGMFIILLSVLLIPMGLRALADEDAEARNVDPASVATTEGFRIMHERVPDEYFEIIESPRGGEFPLYYIVAITILNLVAIVVHPHMAVTGGGSAKTENSARVGLVVGNFLKRLCTIGWCITILIVLAYMAGNLEIAKDPDQTWGIAAREILKPYGCGLVGLMLACLMAALMSSASAYMLIVSALVVRNFYATYVNAEASERTCVLLGRLISALVIVGGAWGSVVYMDIFEQMKIAWEMPILFAAIFWVGMFWRRAGRWAAWGAVLFTLLAFFVVPSVLPLAMPTLADHPQYAVTTDFVTTTVTRTAAPTDVAQRRAAIRIWQQKVQRWLEEDNSRTEAGAVGQFGPCPQKRELGQTMTTVYEAGGQPIYWTGKVVPVDEQGHVLKFDNQGQVTATLIRQDDGTVKEVPADPVRPEYLLEQVARDSEDQNAVKLRQRFRPEVKLRGSGRFRIDFLLYDLLRIDMTRRTKPMLETLRLPTRVILPFVVLIVLSCVTPRVKRQPLDRFYAKMKTPVDPDPEADKQQMEKSYADPTRFDHKRLFPWFGLEFQKPKWADILGFVVCFAICFLLIWLTVWLAKLGS